MCCIKRGTQKRASYPHGLLRPMPSVAFLLHRLVRDINKKRKLFPQGNFLFRFSTNLLICLCGVFLPVAILQFLKMATCSKTDENLDWNVSKLESHFLVTTESHSIIEESKA